MGRIIVIAFAVRFDRLLHERSTRNLYTLFAQFTKDALDDENVFFIRRAEVSRREPQAKSFEKRTIGYTIRPPIGSGSVGQWDRNQGRGTDQANSGRPDERRFRAI